MRRLPILEETYDLQISGNKMLGWITRSRKNEEVHARAQARQLS